MVWKIQNCATPKEKPKIFGSVDEAIKAGLLSMLAYKSEKQVEKLWDEMRGLKLDLASHGGGFEGSVGSVNRAWDCILEPRKRTVKERRLDALLILRVFEHFAELAAREGSSWSCKEHANAGRKVLQAYLFSFSGEDGSRLIYQIFSSIKLREPGWSQRFYQRVNRRTLMHYYDVLCAAFQSLDTSVAISEVAISEVWTRMPGIRGLVAHLMAAALEAAQDEKNTTGTVKIIVAGHGFLGSAQAVSASVAALKYLPAPVKIVCYGFGGDASVESLVLKQCKALDRNQREYEAYFFSGKYDPVNSRPPLLVYKRDGYKLVKEGTKAKSAVPDPFTYVEVSGPAPVSAESTLPPPRSDGGNSESGSTDEVANSIDVGLGDVPPQPATDNLPSPPSAPTVLREHDLSDLESANLASSSPRSELEIRSQSLANALVSGQAPEKEPTARIAEDSTLADASRDAIEKAADLIGETNRVIINKSKADTRGKAISEERQADASPRLVDSAKGLYLVDGKSWHVGNRYKLKGRIESGPIDICRATDSKTGDVVALRRIPNILGSSELAKQVLREVFMIRRLSHPYIISALDVFTRTSREVDNGIDLYVATEYGEGRVDLRDLSASELYQIMRKVLKAVQYLHSQKICHMNINPRELLFFQGTKLKVKLQGLAWAQSALEAYAGGGSSSGMLGPLPSVSVPWPPIQLQSEGDPTRSQHTMSPEPIMTAMTATLEATRAINAALAVINTQHQVLMGALTQQLQLPAVLGSVSIQQEVAAIKDQPFVLASGRSRAKLMQLLQESPRSISYQAPEVLIPSGMPHTSAVDVWSLGCSFWELLMLQTQDFAYTGGALFNMVDEQTSFEGSYEPAPSPSGLHTNLDAQSRQQLNVIFDVIGTPSSEYLEAVPNEEWRIYLKGLTHRPRKLDPHMAKLDPQAAALLSSMLVFDPSRRCTIKEALAHSLFRGLEDPSELAPSPLSSVEPSFWSVEDPSLALGLLERELDQVTGGITGKLKLLVEQVVYGQPGLPSAKTASGVLQDGTSLPTFPEASAKAASSSSPSAATSSTLQEYGSKVLGETVRPPEDEETMEAGENGDGQGGGDHMVGDKAGWTPEASLRVPSLMLEAGSKWEGQSNEKPVSNLHFEDANEEAASDVKADGTTKVSAEAGPELAWKYWEATLERIPLALQRAIEEGKELEETKEVSVAVTAEVDSFAHWTSLTRPEQEAPLVSEPTLVMRLSESKVVVAGRVNAKDLQELEKQVSSLEFPREVEAAHPDGQGAEPEVEPRPPPVLEKLVESLQPSPRDVQSLALSPTSSNLSSPLLYGEGTDLKVWNCLQTQATNGQTAIVGIIDQAWDPTVVYHIGGAKLVRIIHNLKGVDWETMEFPALREEVALCPHDGSPRSYFTLLLAKDAMEIQAVAPAGDVHGMDMVKIVAANAPDAEILYWDLDLGTKLGNETGVPMAANIIFKYATNMKRPCIISCSLQQRLGSHDHHDWLARRLDSLLGGSALPRAIAIAAGNYHSQAGYHARFKGEDVRFTLLLAKPRKGHQEESHIDPGNSRGQTPKEAEEYCTVELWVDCREPLEVTGTFKLGRYEWTDTLNTRDRPKRTAHFPRAFSGRAGLSIRWTIESPSSKERPHCVRIRLERSGVLEKDHLTVTFASQAWTDETAVHAWTNRQIHVIPLNSKGGKDLERSNQLTLSSFAGGSKSVVVASCDDAEELLSESSSGPTRTGHHQPLLAARGLFPSNRVGASQSGTSHATAAMAALIALRMQRLEEKELESFDARSELKEAFRQAGGEANDQDQEHNGRSGYGIVGKSVANAFVRGIGGPKC